MTSERSTIATAYVEALTEFLRLEETNRFFDAMCGRVAFWDLVRPSVFEKLHLRVSSTGQAATPPAREGRDLRRLLNALAPRHNPWLMPRREVLFWGHSRRQLLDDGRYWDLYIDPLLDGASTSFNYVEEPFRTLHLKPTRTEQVRYSEPIFLPTNMTRR